MNELKSYTEYTVSTPTADFVIGFDFNYGEDAVNVTVDDVPATTAGYTVVYLNETTIRLSPSVPSGVVRLQRETDIDQTDHAYRAGAKFIAQTMDENFEQLRHSQQEVRDGFSKLSADTHEIIAGLDTALELAQDAAQDAQDAAAIAQGAADTVNTIIVGGKVAASNVLDASGDTQQQVNYNGGSKWHSREGGYRLNERAILTNGDIVKSIVDGNTNNPNVAMTGWVKPEKIFNIEYFGGVADYDETTKTILTDSGDALREAIVEAKKVMGCVYIPSSPKGKAFYASGNFNLSVDGFPEGVRIIGDGKIASKLYASPIDVTKPIFGGETGAPGNPTNISISGMSLISHEKWVGTCLQFNGTCITEIPDLYIKDFDCNIEFVNDTLAPNGIFTEFVRVSNTHLRNGRTNLRFSRRNNGDASFHGVNFSGLSMDGTDAAGQIGIDIGEGCYIYSASWSQVNIFSTGEGIALKNAGNRNGFDELYFEGNGRVENTSTGTWNTDGRWFVQNETGSFDDRSVGNTQFITGNYQTSKNNTSEDFTNLGLSKFRAGSGDTARKKLSRLNGDGLDAFALNFYTGNANSWSGTQGLALTYSTNNEQNSSPDGIACYLTLNRFSSFLSEYNFSYKQDTPQLTINSSGRHTGRMGRYKSVVVPISGGGQTVTITGLMPTTKQSVLISIDCSANNISYSALYLCSKWDGATTTGVLIGISRFENMPSGISQVYTNDGGLNIVFDSAVNVSLNMNISVVGIGIY